MRTLNGAPTTLFLDITSKCQCRCRHCYNNSGEAACDELSTQEIDGILNDFAQIGGLELRLSGGEPTLHPDFQHFVEVADRLSLRTILVSNGMIDDPLLDYLCNSAISAFYLSLQGDENIHDSIRGDGSYALCTRTAKKLADAGKRVRLSMVFHRENYRFVNHVVEEAAKIGADAAFNPLRPFGNASAEMMLTAQEHFEMVREIVQLRNTYPGMRINTPWDFLLFPPSPISEQTPAEFKRIGCGNIGIAITSTGDCFTCGQLSKMPEFCTGNVRKEDIKTIWSRAQQSCPLATAAIADKCNACGYLYGSPCFGGCAATAYKVSGSMQAVDPYCFVDYIYSQPKGVVI